MIKYDFSLLLQPEDKTVGISEDSELWLPARLGRITASKRAHTILHSRPKTISLMMDEMAQEMTVPPESFSNKYTEHGHAFEEQAINEYAMMRLTFGKIVKKPGLFVHPEHDIASATPDFFEGDDITGQVKCPYKLKNHLSLLHFGCKMVNSNYYSQVQFESFITGRPKIVFVSYHADAPAANQVFIEEIDRDEQMHERWDEELRKITHMLVNDERPSYTEEIPGADGIPDLF